MDDATLLRITQWRKRLERNGWTGVRRATPPHSSLIEYHLVWRGHLVSGRIRLSDHSSQDVWQPGTTMNMLLRGTDVTDGAWRVARDQAGRPRQVHRRLPL
ncbi:hypothetical protein CVH10_01490 [Halomonas sp. ND22Bw]|nr:hypothetical protein CVH10_01490 [Halomonas sp. ND22Bw]